MTFVGDIDMVRRWMRMTPTSPQQAAAFERIILELDALRLGEVVYSARITALLAQVECEHQFGVFSLDTIYSSAVTPSVSSYAKCTKCGLRP